MRNVAGVYRARGENTKTGGAVIGEISLTQAGFALAGTYRFWEERGTEPVRFGLPWQDCDVSGEVLTDKIVPRDALPQYHDMPVGGWDVMLRIGSQDLHGVLLADGDIALSSRSDYFDYCEVFYRQ
jgi:hypothetical protein